MHKKVACPRCEGLGFVTKINPFYLSSESCPSCHGVGYYLVPITNRDVLSRVSEDQTISILGEVVIKSFIESLLVVHGAVLNDSQKECIKDHVIKSLKEFLESKASLRDPRFGDLSGIDTSDFIPSIEDVVSINGVK